ncbi:MAG: hypothetical protein ABSA92_14525 [Candidatus Bathyarchaeia archaeon]
MRVVIRIILILGVSAILVLRVVIRIVLILRVVIRIVLILRVSTISTLTHEIAPDYLGCGAAIKPTSKDTSTFQFTCGIAFTCSPVFAFIMPTTYSGTIAIILLATAYLFQ